MSKKLTTGSIRLEKKLEISTFRAIDRQFAKFLITHYNADESTALAGAVTSALVASGHSCFSLEEYSGKTLGEGDEQSIQLPKSDEWIAQLARSSAIGKPGGENLPLILDGNKLYINKYFNYENRVAERLTSLRSPDVMDISQGVIDLAKDLFSENNDLSAYDGHLQAAGGFLPFFSRLSIISGGPGTGKTTVLSKTLALICKQAIEQGATLPIIKLAAPTGKAAQRMGESISKAISAIPDQKIVEHLSSLSPSTLHRLLGVTGYSPRPRYDAKTPIEADIVVIDESSMIDITMFTRLIDALPPNARLILLGDRHQLASVDAGSVMADICSAFSPNTFSVKFSKLVNSVIAKKENAISVSSRENSLSPLVELQYSYRFEGDKPIGLVSKEINKGSVESAIAILKADQSSDNYCKLLIHPGDASIAKIVLDGYQSLFEAINPEKALEELGKFMVLTALNDGRFGREGINQLVYNVYGGVPPVRPIKITENSILHGLFNGDMGVIMNVPDSDGKNIERAYFPATAERDQNDPDTGGNVRSFLVGMLPAFVNAFAITIHNSQGSEFDKVAIILPQRDTSLLTRELLYTAITRAKTKAEIYGTEEIFSAAVKKKISRHSGLAKRLATHG